MKKEEFKQICKNSIKKGFGFSKKIVKPVFMLILCIYMLTSIATFFRSCKGEKTTANAYEVGANVPTEDWYSPFIDLQSYDFSFYITFSNTLNSVTNRQNSVMFNSFIDNVVEFCLDGLPISSRNRLGEYNLLPMPLLFPTSSEFYANNYNFYSAPSLERSLMTRICPRYYLYSIDYSFDYSITSSFTSNVSVNHLYDSGYELIGPSYGGEFSCVPLLVCDGFLANTSRAVLSYPCPSFCVLYAMFDSPTVDVTNINHNADSHRLTYWSIQPMPSNLYLYELTYGYSDGIVVSSRFSFNYVDFSSNWANITCYCKNYDNNYTTSFTLRNVVYNNPNPPTRFVYDNNNDDIYLTTITYEDATTSSAFEDGFSAGQAYANLNLENSVNAAYLKGYEEGSQNLSGEVIVDSMSYKAGQQAGASAYASMTYVDPITHLSPNYNASAVYSAGVTHGAGVQFSPLRGLVNSVNSLMTIPLFVVGDFSVTFSTIMWISIGGVLLVILFKLVFHG